MTISRRRAERALKQKGFVQDNKDHRIFYLYADGFKTPIFTYTSHGGREIDDYLLSLMKRELRLRTNRQAQDLLNCPMTGEDYIRWLREQGILRFFGKSEARTCSGIFPQQVEASVDFLYITMRGVISNSRTDKRTLSFNVLAYTSTRAFSI